jgi:hypothetical protein
MRGAFWDISYCEKKLGSNLELIKLLNKENAVFLPVDQNLDHELLKD